MSYEYDADYNETKTTTMGGKTLTSEYDALGRVITKRLNTDNQFTVTYGYRDGANGFSSAMIQGVSNNGRSTSYLYYDDGNIRRIQTPWTTQTFEYDAIGQLIRVNDDDTGHTTVYSYDAGGNMTSEKVYSYTTAAEPATEVLSQRNFTYDTAWKDQMLTCGGKVLTYDGVGNLLSYDGTTFTWTKGRRLSGVTKADGTAAAYTYNHNGQRASKTVGGVKHTYFYSGNLLIREKAGSLDMRFSYDSVGNPVSILYNDVEYYYVKNLQGDIIGLIDIAGTWVVEYSYDVWGNIRNVFGSMASTLGQDNPIRYRGYYYDNETKLYYVLSRYYSPELCRFINPDSISLVGVSPMTLTDKNLYAYCDNNPVCRIDIGGKLWFPVFGAIVGCVLGAASKVICNVVEGNDISDGIVGAAVSGAVYGAITASPLMRMGSHIAVFASYASAAAESLVNEIDLYIRGNEFTVENLSTSAKNVVSDTLLNGTVTYVCGEIGSKVFPINEGEVQPTKLLSAMFGKYAMKTWGQSLVQAVVVTGYNLANYAINELRRHQILE